MHSCSESVEDTYILTSTLESQHSAPMIPFPPANSTDPEKGNGRKASVLIPRMVTDMYQSPWPPRLYIQSRTKATESQRLFFFSCGVEACRWSLHAFSVINEAQLLADVPPPRLHGGTLRGLACLRRVQAVPPSGLEGLEEHARIEEAICGKGEKSSAGGFQSFVQVECNDSLHHRLIKLGTPVGWGWKGGV